MNRFLTVPRHPIVPQVAKYIVHKHLMFGNHAEEMRSIGIEQASR